MKVGVLGTGVVGRTLADRLVELSNEVRMGSRSADGEAVTQWASAAGERGSAGTFADAADYGEVVINATAGMRSLDAIGTVDPWSVDGKVLIDVANPLDFSTGALKLSVCNTDSLCEQIQRALPGARVVKSLNTMNCEVMVHPEIVPGDHVAFVCGNDEGAKQTVADLLGTFGWPAERVVDLGGIEAARGAEMILPLWLSIMMKKGGGRFNFALLGG
jgi:8-hydroxy-5-deazaflavin:NADPH oxidoreductase